MAVSFDLVNFHGRYDHLQLHAALSGSRNPKEQKHAHIIQMQHATWKR